MERKALSNIVIVFFIVILLLAGQSTAFGNAHVFKKCMKRCLFGCVIPPWTVVCPATCLLRCVIHKPPPQSRTNYVQKTHQFCTAGCATSLCSRLISKDDYRLDQVEGCVYGCSTSCSNNYNYVPTPTED
ncbi:hypothetical protein M5689_021630 [Euphorbia peplus]|nr:hypothetical protein M5689_021630 [Euphorbia peplus]